jgi:hypothetical protein
MLFFFSGSANETNGTDKYQDAERGSSSGTESSGFSAPLQAENQPQAGPSFEGIALSIFWIHYQSGGRKQLQCSQKSRGPNTRNTATDNNENDDCVLCKVNYYD